jgi:hypothetical protein
MRGVNLGGGAAVYTKKYDRFRGVDFSTDALLVDDSRSPWAPNLISDTGGMPEKRTGWRTVGCFPSAINGVHFAVIDGEEHRLVHAGTSVYEGETERIAGVADAKSVSVFMNGALYLFTGNEFLVFDGTSLSAVEGRIPEVIIGRSPTGGGGTFLEAVNLIQPRWTEGFLGEAGVTEYQLSYGDLDDAPVTARRMDAGGEWVELTETADFTVDREAGVVTFAAAPGEPAVAGADNVRITASKARDATAVTRAGSIAVFGSCLFAAGAVRGTDYHSGYRDPTYWPDTGYDNVGTDETDIMGYLPIGRYLAVVKEYNAQDPTVFLRYETAIDGETVFAKESSVVGVGAVRRLCFGSLMGEPLFLSGQGVFAVTSNIITGEKMVQNRSYFVDFLLSREPDLENAAAVEYNGYFIVCVNSRCYILDGRQNKTYRKQSSDFVYECYYWTDIPAVCFARHGGQLYFGTPDGRVCVFNTDAGDMTRYSDDGAAIVAEWSTRADDDGSFMARKSLVGTGTGILIKPYTHSSAEVLLETERDFGFVAASARMDILDFSDFDFQKFSFLTSDKPQVVPVRSRVRKYNTLQITVRNARAGEGFGVYGVIKRFCYSGFVR